MARDADVFTGIAQLKQIRRFLLENPHYNCVLEAVSRYARQLKRWHFLFVVAPLTVPGVRVLQLIPWQFI